MKWRVPGMLVLVLAGLVTASAHSDVPARQLGEIAVLGRGPTTLLAIPCASCRWRSFEAFATRNADRFTTIAVTLPGYGGSPLPDLPEFGSEPVWHQHAVDALGALLKERDLRNVIVVGHSFGASIGLQLAARGGNRIAGFVNLDGTLVGPLDRTAAGGADRLAAAQDVRRRFMDPLADLDAWQQFNLPTIAREDRRTVYHGWFMATPRTAVYQYWWDNLLIDRNALLASLKMPVLDVQLYSPRASNAANSRQQYQERVDALGLENNYKVLYYDHVGHFIMEDAPELLDTLLRVFSEGGTYPAGIRSAGRPS